MRSLVIAIIALNVLDLGLTLYGIQTNQITEGNPLLAAMLEISWFHMALSKAGLVCFGVSVFLAYQHHPKAIWGARLSLWCYVLVVSSHLIWLMN